MTDLWSPMDTAPYDKWFLARVEPEKSTQKLLDALNLPQERPRVIVAQRVRGDRLGQVRCSKRHALYTASGWNIPPAMMENT